MQIRQNLIREIEVVIGSILVHSHSDTSEGVGNGNREPPVSDILSIPVLVNVSLECELFEAAVHEMEVGVLIGWGSGVGNKTSFVAVFIVIVSN